MRSASKGMSFEEAIKQAKPNEKITWGTATEKWHLIDEKDIDYNTKFALTIEEAKKLGENGSKASILSPAIYIGKKIF